MKGKHLQYIVWEYDAVGGHDEVYRSANLKILGDDVMTGGFQITDSLFKKGIDFKFGDPDNDSQNYFIEVISIDVSAYSKRFGVSADGLMKVESPAVVKAQKENKQRTTCICQEQYKDLIWGGKVSCEFRKKVVQICAELWRESRKMEMTNGLMAVMMEILFGDYTHLLLKKLSLWKCQKV